MNPNHRAWALVVLGCLSVVACRRGEPSIASGSPTPVDGADAAPATVDTTTIDGGDTSDASDAGTAPADAADGSDDATIADAGPDAPYSPPAICPAALAIGRGTVQPFSTQLGDVGLSVTPDELSVAWVTASNGDVTIHYVDRAATSLPFGAEQTVSGAFANERVALTPDGLSLAVVDADHLGFSLLTRDDRGGPFGAPDAGPFSVLDDQGKNVLGPAGQRYADPLFAAAGSYFIFSRFAGDDTDATVYLGSRIFTGDPYSSGAPFEGTELLPSGGHRRVVTGASVDARTLFVWDEGTGTSRAVDLGPTGAATGSVDLGAVRDVQTTTDCTAFWFTSGAPLQIRRAP